MELKIALEGQAASFIRELEKEFTLAGHRMASPGEEADMLVFCINPQPCEAADYEALLKAYEDNALKLLRVVSEYLPLLQKGKKRICFVTTLRSSINNTRESGHWESVVAAACNMAVRTLFNRLNPLGFTFRVFGIDDYDSLSDASYGVSYMLQDRSMEEESHLHSDEKRIVIRDKFEREYPW